MIITTCPHCNGDIIILENEINCNIFRHAVYKNGCEIPQHSSKIYVDSLIQHDLIWGCGKPFTLKDEKAIECDWI